ncbi:hypothetical protein AVEN_26302-1 [Araneus ventricosus]|uniref:Uncharacterized protein n=1 Tax=Araneus ventricosus TaxID=182803 RepID=A0A4Y2APF2_ARAVE|nr:hypothetical protein AVEN_26302-1 [Araneus ventricosus]
MSQSDKEFHSRVAPIYTFVPKENEVEFLLEKTNEENGGRMERMWQVLRLKGGSASGNSKQEKAGSESSNPIALSGIIGKNRLQRSSNPPLCQGWGDQPKRDHERKLSWRVLEGLKGRRGRCPLTQFC